jgi:hypothetical protein
VIRSSTPQAARRAGRLRLRAWLAATLCSLGCTAAPGTAIAGRWAGEIELPVLEVREIHPAGRNSRRSLVKFEVERIREIGTGQVALKLEHEADVAFDRDEEAEHETKLELDRRWAPGEGRKWETFIRGAFTAAGSLDESVGELDRVELIAGVRRRRSTQLEKTSVEFRLARRYENDSETRAWVPGMKLKWSRPVQENWSLAAEAKLTATLGSPRPDRLSGKLQFYVLRSVERGGPLKVGVMTFVSGSVDSRNSALRAGIGPIFAANW